MALPAAPEERVAPQLLAGVPRSVFVWCQRHPVSLPLRLDLLQQRVEARVASQRVQLGVAREYGVAGPALPGRVRLFARRLDIRPFG
jgi:hypothetical protein